MWFWRERNLYEKSTSTNCWSNFDYYHRCNCLDMIFILVPLVYVYYCCGKQIILHFCFTLMSIVAKFVFSHKGGCGLGWGSMPCRKKLTWSCGRVGMESELAVRCWQGVLDLKDHSCAMIGSSILQAPQHPHRGHNLWRRGCEDDVDLIFQHNN